MSRFRTTFAIGTPNWREIALRWPDSEVGEQRSLPAAEGKPGEE
jgi:hypothetical protein